MWHGKIHPPEHFQQLYSVDDVKFVDELASWLAERLLFGPSVEPDKASSLYLLTGLNTDSGLIARPAQFSEKHKFESVINTTLLFDALSTARLIKSPFEIQLLQYSNYVSSQAHVTVMRHVAEQRLKAGNETTLTEYQLEALFLFEIYSKGVPSIHPQSSCLS